MSGAGGVLGGPVHLVGVGGVGMSAIALLLRERGVATSGSDGVESAALDPLRAAGVVVHVGHAAANVPAGATVVLSSAVRADNPERLAAQAAGLPVVHRSEALAGLMADRRGVAVAGTHGKTTTTGMVTVVLRECGLDPSFAIGGQLTDTGVGAHAGTGEAFVLEADESDGSFVRYRPEVAVITNVEPDHLDHYGTPEAVEDAFAEFCATVRPGGLVVAGGDDAGAGRVLDRVAPELARRDVAVVRYGAGAGNDVVVSDLTETPAGVRFSITAGTAGGPVRLRVPGRYNALNAAAAWSVARHFGANADAARAALGAFGGTRRRFESRGEAGGVRVVDDYAHHPTEVREVLLAARAVAGPGRVIALFQPHLPSRTKAFAAEFGQALALADEVLVLDVYAAREDPDPATTGQLVVDHVTGPPARFVPDAAAGPALVAQLARPGDLVLTVGAGDVTRLGPLIVAELAARAGSPA